MPEVERILERLSSISRVSVTLVDDGGKLLSAWPKEFENCANALANRVVIEDFRRRKRDERHPMVRFVDPGFLLGIVLSFLFFGFGKFVGVKLGTVVCTILNGPTIGAIGRFLDKHFHFCDALPFRPFFEKTGETV